MRKIKFRAWHKKNKRYYKVTTIAFDNESLTLVGMDGAVLFGVPFDDVILEQYTGLNDKNYVEIYAGDIVNYENRVCKVIYNDDRARYELSVYSSLKYEIEIMDGSYMKIIGNIHENGEFLK